MNNDYQTPAFKKLLKKLQEESWQLELLISGFAIFGLFSAFEPLKLALAEAQANDQSYYMIIFWVALISCYILIFNLIFHVLLRGLWIGALGLRYVSGEIDYEELNYSTKFSNYLKKKVGSFDRYIATLENYCSIIFAISFLLIFYVISITLFVLSIAIISTYLINADEFPNWLSKGVGISLVLLIVLGGFLTFIDFFTLGYLKRKKWLSKIYFPFYWVFSLLTLSFLYRPIVYNFLDNRFGRRLILLLIPLLILALAFTSLDFNYSNYFDPNQASNEVIAKSENYEDSIKKEGYDLEAVTIQSKVITDNYIKVFVLLDQDVEDRVFDHNSSLKPEDDSRGTFSTIQFNRKMINGSQRDSLRKVYMNTFNDVYSIQIDSTLMEAEFISAKGTQNRLGFETYISTKNLSEGKHLLKVQYRKIDKADSLIENLARIPFWLFKD